MRNRWATLINWSQFSTQELTGQTQNTRQTELNSTKDGTWHCDVLVKTHFNFWQHLRILNFCVAVQWKCYSCAVHDFRNMWMPVFFVFLMWHLDEWCIILQHNNHSSLHNIVYVFQKKKKKNLITDDCSLLGEANKLFYSTFYHLHTFKGCEF